MKKLKNSIGNALFNCFSEMAKKEGHGFSYELNFNIFKMRAVLTEAFEVFDEAKKAFYQKDKDGVLETFLNSEGEKIYKVIEGKQVEFNEMILKFNSDIFSFSLKTINEKDLKKAIDKKLFDGVDITPLFECGILK
jgi:hypothetical protein